MLQRSLVILASLCPMACIVADFDGASDHDGGPSAVREGYRAIDPCQGAPAVQFPAAVCVCDAFTMVGNLEAYGFENPGGATIAANRHIEFVANAEIDGSVVGGGAVTMGGNAEVGGDLVSSGDVDWLGNLDVAGDISAGGDLRGAGNLDVRGDLRLGGRNLALGNLDFGGFAPYVEPAAAPCPCEPGSFFDVEGAVAAAAGEPDVARIAGDVLGNASIRLSDGAYYLEDASWVGNVDLVIDGNVDIYVADDLSSIGNGDVELTTGSTLDLYVAGAMRSVGNVWVGGGVPGAVRIYLGGADSVMLHAGNAEFVASLYAPMADVAYVGNTDITGAIFARSLVGEGNMTIGYPGLFEPPPPQRCPPDDDESPPRDPSGDDGDPPRDPPGDDGPDDDTDDGPGDDTDDGPGDDTDDGPDDDGPGDDGGPTCPDVDVDTDCYDVADKYACIDTEGCMWKHGPDYCTWQACGGLDETTCGLDPGCTWSACNEACYPG